MHDIFLGMIVDGADVEEFYKYTKRRIYDCLSVFKGLGQIEKTHGRWKFVGPEKWLFVVYYLFLNSHKTSPKKKKILQAILTDHYEQNGLFKN